MKKNLITLALICASLLCTTVCSAETVVKETRETGAFRKISTSGGIDVYFTQADSYKITVEADEKYIGKIATEVKGETLVVEWKEKIRIFGNRTAKVHVSAPALDRVSASGGADFYAGNLKCEGSFQLSASGGADANITALSVSKNVDISTSGGADTEIENLSVEGNTDISVSGGADCDVKNLQTVDCKLSASGGGDLDIKLTVSGNLNASASGGADISIAGKANEVKISASGGADVDIKKLTYTNIDITKSGGGDVYR